jgi:signal transduction histidine kinase
LIEFQDNGPGIAAKDRRRVFEKFARGQRGASSGQTGSGLGLAISSQIIARMKGKIDLVKVADDGACFRVSLPLYEGEV